jgi:ribosome-associated heat shock protein Hsp15
LSITDQDKKIRIDKWLWAARFFKVRAVASQAVAGGHVYVNGERAKPSRGVQIGDELRITRGNEEFVVVVTGLHDRRGPATLARTLYEETVASCEARQKAHEQRRLLAASNPVDPVRRPGKRDRRLIRRFIRGSEE